MKDKNLKKVKRPYIKPQINCKKIYEENALACGKNPQIRRTGPCRLNAQS